MAKVNDLFVVHHQIESNLKINLNSKVSLGVNLTEIIHKTTMNHTIVQRKRNTVLPDIKKKYSDFISGSKVLL